MWITHKMLADCNIIIFKETNIFRADRTAAVSDKEKVGLCEFM